MAGKLTAKGEGDGKGEKVVGFGLRTEMTELAVYHREGGSITRHGVSHEKSKLTTHLGKLKP